MKQVEGGVCAAKGFKANGIHCGVRKNKTNRDLALIYSENRAAAAAVYTTNLVKGAPITVTKQNIADGYAQAVICNSGIANACTGAEGYGYCKATADAASEILGIPADSVLVASTGVIGMQIPIDRIVNGVKAMAPKRS